MSQRQYDDVMMIKWWRNNNVTLRSNANNFLKCGSIVHLDHSTDSSSTIVPNHLPPTWTFTGKIMLFFRIFCPKFLCILIWNLPEWDSTNYCKTQNDLYAIFLWIIYFETYQNETYRGFWNYLPKTGFWTIYFESNQIEHRS